MTPLALNAYLHKNVIIQMEDATQLAGILIENDDGTYSVQTSGTGTSGRFAASDVASVSLA